MEITPQKDQIKPFEVYKENILSNHKGIDGLPYSLARQTSTRLVKETHSGEV